MTETRTRGLLDTEDASAYLSEVHNYEERPSTLTRKRTEGGGPKYIRNGKRALYDPHDLDTYIAELPRYAATFEEAEKRLDRESADV